LECKLVSGVGSAIDDIESRGRENERRLNASEVSEIFIQRNTLLGGASHCYSNGYTQAGVGAKFCLVGRPVEFDEPIVNFLLRSGFQTSSGQIRVDYIVDIGDGSADTF
jgi:hypothetical protein